MNIYHPGGGGDHIGYIYMQIDGHTGSAMSNTIVAGHTITAGINYRSPVQFGPTGAIPISVYGYCSTASGVNVTQTNLFALGNLQ